MADILPFRGMIYNLKKVGDISLVTSPPYDVISQKARTRYYERHPNNIIRLELGEDIPGEDHYSVRKRYFEDWQKEKILIREEEPAFYYYRVIFPLEDGSSKTRYGFVGLCRLEDFGKGMIFPHERIHQEQKDDRLRVLESCRANFSQIFSLYPDAGQKVDSLFKPCLSQPPLFDFTEEGIRHSLWSVKDKTLIRLVREEMKEKPLFIADGHHRYEAALAYKHEMQVKSASSKGNESFNYVMMYFCPFEDEGLTILPSHRLVFPLPKFELERFEAQLPAYFMKKDIPFDLQNEPAQRVRFLAELKEAGEKGIAFGLYVHGNPYYSVLVFKREGELHEITGKSIPAVLQKLDVVILHRLIFDQILGIEEKDQDLTRIQITKNQNSAIDLVSNGQFQMAFLLNSPRVKAVQEVASAGQIMPQKSTFFYPKLPTGLVLNKIGFEETVDELIP